MSNCTNEKKIKNDLIKNKYYNELFSKNNQ